MGIIVIAVALPTRGDQIVVGGPQSSTTTSHSPVTIMGLDGGQLMFRTQNGETMVVWMDDVQRLTVDQSNRNSGMAAVVADFNEAERNLAAGEPEKAIVRYQRSLRLSDSFWPELIAARLVRACGQADRIDQAALHFVRVLRGEHSGPALAVRLIPQILPTKRDDKTIRAIEHLQGALQQTTSADQRIPLELFRFALLHDMGDKRFGQDARRVAGLEIPERLRCDRAYEIQSIALERSLADTVDKKSFAALHRAIRDCPKTMLPVFLLLKGESLMRTASTREDYIRAAWPFMRVVVHMPDHALVPRALLGTARAVDRIGRKDKAVLLLEEGLAFAGLDPETRIDLQQTLDRLRAADNGVPTAVEKPR